MSFISSLDNKTGFQLEQYKMMSIINTTINVASMYECNSLAMYENTVNTLTPIWKQTVAGCHIINSLKEIYGFNVSYIYEDIDANVTEIGGDGQLPSSMDQSIDVYLRPMIMGLDHLKYMYPVHAAYTLKFGFLLRRPDYSSYITFYSKPFSRLTWNCLYGMAFLVSILFYILKRWEFATVGGAECCYIYEILTIIGAYCQHIPPTDTKLLSRRIAYFVFLTFSFLIYTYYTSNLLSHLVNDKDHGITLETLAKTNLKIVIVDYMSFRLSQNVPSYVSNYNLILSKLLKLQTVSISQGIEGVRLGEIALLSEYIGLTPFLKKSYNRREVCEISSIDLFNNMKKYLFTSKRFLYKEQFKIGMLRLEETGILKRLISIGYKRTTTCDTTYFVPAMFIQILIPLAVLFGTYAISICILFIERLYYKRHTRKLWPYVE